MRYIESDERLSLRGDKLVEAIRHDREKGLVPFFLCATLGTTGACAFDHLRELGPICEREEIWLHVDAAYAGTAFICPEFRKWLDGIEFGHSFAFNPSKWMMVHFDSTAMWVRNSGALHRTFNVDPLYLKHENTGLAIDYMHWQIPLSKRFRALKMWFVIRSYGVKGLQKHIREGVRLAKKFEHLVRGDARFEVPAERHLGMVVFRLKGDNELTEKLLKKLNSSGKVHAVPASLKGKYVIRFTVTSTHTTDADIERDWGVVVATAETVLRTVPPAARMRMGDIKKANPNFGTSLLLANSPMSPKIVNGSYVAILDQRDIVVEFAHKFGGSPGGGFRFDLAKDSPAMRRRVRGMLMTGKQYSLDSRMDLVQTIVSSAGGSRNAAAAAAVATLPCHEEASGSIDEVSSLSGSTEDILEEKSTSGGSDGNGRGRRPTLPDASSSGSGSRTRSKSVGDDDHCCTSPTSKRTFPRHEAAEGSKNGLGGGGVCRKCGHAIPAAE